MTEPTNESEVGNAISWAQGKRLDAKGRMDPEPHAKTLAAEVLSLREQLWAEHLKCSEVIGELDGIKDGLAAKESECAAVREAGKSFLERLEQAKTAANDSFIRAEKLEKQLQESEQTVKAQAEEIERLKLIRQEDLIGKSLGASQSMSLAQGVSHYKDRAECAERACREMREVVEAARLYKHKDDLSPDGISSCKCRLCVALMALSPMASQYKNP